MTDEVESKSRGERDLEEALQGHPIFIDGDFAPDPDFEERLREIISSGRGKSKAIETARALGLRPASPRRDVWEMLANEEDLSDL
jgi:hypothetical protein